MTTMNYVYLVIAIEYYGRSYNVFEDIVRVYTTDELAKEFIQSHSDEDQEKYEIRKIAIDLNVSNPHQQPVDIPYTSDFWCMGLNYII
jgi:hypothetical protein